MAIQLSDDGTLDTVLRCSECGEEMRFSFQSTMDDSDVEDDHEKMYEVFVDDCIEETAAEHECKSTHQTPVTADNYFDAAQALYWYATAWHGGQDSELYSILSARLGYTPGCGERGIDTDTSARDFYAELAGGGWGPTDLCAAVNAFSGKD